jgi:bis(5'-nucleosidyl)-tetraphosphatase
MIKYDESFGIIPLRRAPDGSWELFLILHKSGHHWTFPKGHKEHVDEEPFSTAERELFEETGLHVVKKLSLPSFHEIYDFRHRGRLVRKKVGYFAAEVAGEIRLQAEEVRDGRWVSFTDAFLLLTFKEAQAICSQVLEHLSKMPQ